LYLTEEEAIKMTIAQSHLAELTQWHGLAVQLWDSALAQGRPVSPPFTLRRSQA
jgi:hypothetical protein